jgi:O-methyltransferase involved in polyketide biosynthesis
LKFFGWARRFVSDQKLREIFDWRLRMSAVFDLKIFHEKPEQVIDLAAGYSMRGFNLCSNNDKIVYVDSDLPNVISRKREILEKMCLEQNIPFPPNYLLVSIDVLQENFFENIKDIIDVNKKTLVTAEGLTSYFKKEEFEIFIQNIKDFLSNFSFSEFYSHENTSKSTSLAYKILRKSISLLTRTKSRERFSNETDFADFLRKSGTIFTLDTSNEGFLFYSIFKS